MSGRRRFGRVRKLPSGRYQARYSTPDGREHPAPDTFASKTAAERWLASVETDMARGQWIDPRSRQLLLSGYAESWLAARPDLKIRTRELYQWLLGKYVLPQLGHLPLDKITPGVVRNWHAGLLRDAAPTPTRQAYSLLRAMLNTAVADELLPRNPAPCPAPVSAAPASGRPPPSPRSPRSLTPFRLATGCSSCLPPGPAPAGASSSRSAVIGSTSTTAS
jgi:hypothetical protein